MNQIIYLFGLLLSIIYSSNIYSQCISGDCQNGKGTMIYSNGDRHEGNWSNGKLNGFGIGTYSNGDKYEGNFINDYRSGKGKAFFANGNLYEGDFFHNYRTGYGTMIYKDGIKYEGNWSQSKSNGFGIQTWPNGDRYEGNWLNDKRNGKGKAFWANGDRFEGDFVDDFRTGFGKLLKKDGTIQEGKWLNNVFQGVELASSNTQANTQEKNCDQAKKKYLEQNPDVAKSGMDAWNHYTIFGKKEGRKWPNCTDEPNPTKNSPVMDRFYNAQPTIPIALNKEDFENKIIGIIDVNSKLSYIRSVIENTTDVDLKLHAIAAFTTAVVYNLNVNTEHIIYARNQSESIIKFMMENGIDNSEKEGFKIQSYVYILCQTKIDKNLNSFNHEIINLVLSNYTADTYIDKKFYQDLKDSMDEYENKANVNTQNSKTPVSSLPDGDIIWKHSKGSFEFKFKEGDKRIWHEDGGRFIYVEEEFYNDGTMEGSGQVLKRKNENVYIKLTFDKCYFKDNSNPNWRIIYNGGFYSKTLARYLVVDDFNKSSQSTSTSTSTSNVTVNKTVSNYTFTKAPELKINYLDNRKMCCCCDRTYSQYKVRENVMIEEKIHYLTEKLAIFHQQNGNALLSETRNETQIQNDLANLKAFLNKTYPGNDILIMLTDMYHLSFMSGIMIFNKTKPGSTERFVEKYEITSPFCSSLKCKNDARCKSCN